MERSTTDDIPEEVATYAGGLVAELKRRVGDSLVFRHVESKICDGVRIVGYEALDGEASLGELTISLSLQTKKKSWQGTYKGLVPDYNNDNPIILVATDDGFEAEKQFVYPDITLTHSMSSYRLDGHEDLDFATGDELHPIPQRGVGLFATDNPRRIEHLLKPGSSDLERALTSYTDELCYVPDRSGSDITLDIETKKKKR
jgi:hypothetical protein